jgi:hypothetical protein
MHPRHFMVGIAAIVLAVPSLSRGDDSKALPTLVVRVRSIDDLLQEIKYLGGLAGKDSDTKKLDDVIKKKLPGGFAGIDTKRPIGFYGKLDENLLDSTAVAMVPVADEKAVLDLLKQFHLEATKEDDGGYVVNHDNGPPVYFRFVKGYAYVTVRDKSALAQDKLIPAAGFFANQPAATVSVSFRIDQIPNEYKQLLLGQTELRIVEATEKKEPNETDQEHAIKKESGKQVSQLFATVIKEGADLSVRFNVDRTAQKLQAEVSLTATSGSALASSIRAMGNSESLFGGMLEAGSAARFGMHGALPPSLRDMVGSALVAKIKHELANEKDQGKRAAGEKLLEAIAPTLRMGELDLGIVLSGPTADGHYGFVGAVKLKEGKKLQETLREILKSLPEADRSKVTLDVESVGDVHISRIDKLGLDEDAQKTLGDNPGYIAFRDDAVLLAGGEGGLSLLKDALQSKPKVAPLVQLELSATKMAPAIAASGGKKGKSKEAKGRTDVQAVIARAFGSGKDNDKIVVTLEGGDALRLRFDMGAPVLKFFHLMEEQKKEKK